MAQFETYKMKNEKEENTENGVSLPVSYVILSHDAQSNMKKHFQVTRKEERI